MFYIIMYVLSAKEEYRLMFWNFRAAWREVAGTVSHHGAYGQGIRMSRISDEPLPARWE